MSTFIEDHEAIKQAIHLGISCDELPDMEPEAIDHLAAWLASEGIGKR